ncbi:nuclear transport factor 2 family protein [Arthrobacter globiformis]|uniref:nuclear transport factor 2 family protein n=1 Tax=Arthrobacter globiformis TaxID=1665 RepID=UPI00279328A5|nr:nuclear transport factor 2 family protein [Arthrobacter globiformis]MDQ0617035.1 ketosteroid isomerase-like protein [Arthrobacter globiformis]
MGTQEDAGLVRRGYEAFAAGDMDTLRGLFAEDAVWHVGGSGGLSGDKLGRDAVLAYLGELFTRSDGTLRVDLDDLIGGENHTVGFQRVHAQRNGAAIDQRAVVVFALKDGKVSEAYEFPEDTAKAAEFWS